MVTRLSFFDLLDLIRQGKAPKKIYCEGETYEWNGTSYKSKSDIMLCEDYGVRHTEYGFISLLNIEVVEPVLDDIEKEYLGNIVKPFRNIVQYISKGTVGKFEYEYIFINIKEPDGSEGNICFPNYKYGKMYKGMEPKKKYTLEELEL